MHVNASVAGVGVSVGVGMDGHRHSFGQARAGGIGEMSRGYDHASHADENEEDTEAVMMVTTTMPPQVDGNMVNHHPQHQQQQQHPSLQAGVDKLRVSVRVHA